MRESANEIAPRRPGTPSPPIVAAPESEARYLSSSLSLSLFFSLARPCRPSHLHSCPLRFHCISLFSASGVFIAGARASVRNVGQRNIRLSPCTGPIASLRFRARPSADAIACRSLSRLPIALISFIHRSHARKAYRNHWRALQLRKKFACCLKSDLLDKSHA